MNQSTVLVEQSVLAPLPFPPLHSLMTTILINVFLIFVHLGSIMSTDLSQSRWKGDPPYRVWGCLSGSFDRSGSALANSNLADSNDVNSNRLYSLLIAQ
jgi:hypothetical protein